MIRQWNDKEQGYELDSALHFMRLVEICRKCSVPELKQIEEAVRAIGKNTQEVQQQHGEEQAASIYRDALAVAATRNTLFVLAEKIMKEEIKPVKAAQLLKAFISNQHSPSERQADILERIAKHEVTKQSSALKQVHP
jgi:Mg2+ and Co2+ transporter CorA